MQVQEREEAASRCGDYPAAPDSPAEATDARRDDRDDDRARQEQEEDREDVDAALNRRRIADGHEVEGHVVECCKELLVSVRQFLKATGDDLGLTRKPWANAQ